MNSAPVALRTATTDHATAAPSLMVPLLPLLPDPDGFAPAGDVPDTTGGFPVVLFGATLPVVYTGNTHASIQRIQR